MQCGVFSRGISQLSKIGPPPSLHEEPLKFIVHGRIFRKLWNIARSCHYTPLLWSFPMPCCLNTVASCVCKRCYSARHWAYCPRRRTMMMYSAAQSACRKVASASVSDKTFHKHLYLPFVAQSQHLQTHLLSKIPLSYLKELFPYCVHVC